MSDDSLLVDLTYQSTNASVLTGSLNAKRFKLFFRNVVCIRIERLQHTSDSPVDEFLWINLIDIVCIHFFKQSREDVEALGDLEILFGGWNKGHQQYNRGGEKGDFKGFASHLNPILLTLIVLQDFASFSLRIVDGRISRAV